LFLALPENTKLDKVNTFRHVAKTCCDFPTRSRWHHEGKQVFWVNPISHASLVDTISTRSPADRPFWIIQDLMEIQQAWYWPGMHKEVKSYCKSCHMCLTVNPSQNIKPAPMDKMDVVSHFGARA
jgi:hypothetical protein